MHDPPTQWHSPERLIEIGFARSRVVMMNEAHDGLRRSMRTRRIGKQVLPTAHAAGVRHLAMEALTPEFARQASDRRVLPAALGYLGQPDMRELIGAALGLGWTLVAYEADHNRRPAGFASLSMEETNWREEEQARNLVGALAGIGEDAKLLVWCGNSHLSKRVHDDWQPMGARFVELSGIELFAIDQTQSIGFDSLAAQLVDRFRVELAGRGGTAGFLVEDSRSSWFGVDAVVLSLDNELR